MTRQILRENKGRYAGAENREDNCRKHRRKDDPVREPPTQ
jgi:hypothetical protein